MVNSPRPSSFSRTLALVPPVVALVAQQANGAIFLKLDTIPGESVDSKHAGWIDVSSLQFGIGNAVTIGSGGISAGKASGSEITFTKQLDKSSPPLFLSCAQGTVQPTVKFELTTTNASGSPVVYYRITLTNAVVSGFNTSSGGDRPSESVSMSYEKIFIEYYMMDAKGTVPTTPTSSATWSFVTNSTK